VFGARRLGGVCAALQELGEAGALDGAGFLLERLTAEAGAFLDELRLLPQHATPGEAAFRLQALAETFCGRRILTVRLPARLARQMGTLLGALEAHVAPLPEAGPLAAEWQLSADLVVVAGEDGAALREECRSLARRVRGAAVLVTAPSAETRQEAGRLRAAVTDPGELRDVLRSACALLKEPRRMSASARG
jgi:hypothetical protein